jgi:hypothetical protein
MTLALLPRLPHGLIILIVLLLTVILILVPLVVLLVVIQVVVVIFVLMPLHSLLPPWPTCSRGLWLLLLLLKH